MEKLKVIFMGTPTFSVPVLESLIKKYDVALVVSQPDREKDRKGNLLETPVKKIAQEHNIKVFQPLKIKDEYQQIIDIKPDLIVTCAYGQIIPKIILDCPKYGCINVHGSLLPKLRGGAPIHHAIINGNKKTGITIMYMDQKMDAGDIISQEEILIDDNDNLDSLYLKMSKLGAKLLVKTIPLIISGESKRIKQNENDVTFGYNITKEEEKIDFHRSSKDIHNLIRGLSSIPGAYCVLDNKRMKVYSSQLTNNESSLEEGTIVNIDDEGIYVCTSDNIIKLTEIKLEGKKRCRVKEFKNGINIKEYIGKVLK